MLGKRPGETTNIFNARKLKELEEALESEAVEISECQKPRDLVILATQDTDVIPENALGNYEDHIKRDTQIRISGKERKTETRQFEIGKGERGEYPGPTSLQYIVKNLVEHHNTRLNGDNIEEIREGQYIQVIALGYRIGEKRIAFVGEDDSIVAESSIYQVAKHPEGYLWSEPAVGMSEVAGDLLQGHPLAKDLTKEERYQSQVWIQLAHIPDKEVIERLKIMNNGTGTPIKNPEDAIGKLHKNFEEAAETRLTDFFSEEKTPTQTPKPKENSQPTAKDLSARLKAIKLDEFKP